MDQVLAVLLDETGPFRYALAMAFVFAVVGIFVTEEKFWGSNPPRLVVHVGLLAALSGVFAMAGLVVVSFVTVGAWGWPHFLDAALSPWFFFPAIVAAIFLFWLRQRRPIIYGAIEAVLAVCAIWAATHGTWTDPGQHLITIVGGVYFLIRGLDNINKGLPARWWRYRLVKRSPAEQTAPPPGPATR